MQSLLNALQELARVERFRKKIDSACLHRLRAHMGMRFRDQ